MAPGSQSLPQRVERWAAETPDRVAIEDLTRRTAVTYAALAADVRRWAGALGAHGVGAGEAVVMLVPNTLDAYVIWLGIAHLRAIAVPMNVEYRGRVLEHALQTTGARTAVVHASLVERVAEAAPAVPALETLVVLDPVAGAASSPLPVVDARALLEHAQPSTAPAPGRADPAVVMFTSGTTGPSKGALAAWGYYDSYDALYPEEVEGLACRVYSPWAVWHSSGHASLANATYRGGTLLVRERWRTQEFWSDVRASEATATMVLASAANALWQATPEPDDADNPLRDVLMAPVTMDPSAFARRFGVRLHTGFAMSETGAVFTCRHPIPNPRTCGEPSRGYEVRLVDGGGRDVADGQPGELWVRAQDRSLLFAEYLNMREATEEAWHGGWLHSGDVFRRDGNGFYYFLDRLKDAIRRRGENISSLEVEAAINAHSAVIESAVVGVRDELGEEEVMAYVVLQDRAQLQEPDLVGYLEPRLPRFMIPRYVELVDELPKTPATGRVRKLELRKRGLGERTWDRTRPHAR